MYKEFYQDSSLLIYPLFALLFFVVVFAAVVGGTLRRKTTSRFDALSQLPLSDDESILAKKGRAHES